MSQSVVDERRMEEGFCLEDPLLGADRVLAFSPAKGGVQGS